MTRFSYGFRAFRVVLAIVLAGAASHPSQAEIILSEVMFRPINGNANSEWVEIFNAGASSVNLSGWQFGMPSAGTWTSAFPAGTSLGAGQALVITPSASTFDSNWGAGKNRIQVSNFPSLPDSPSGNGGRIAIRNGSGVIQDEISYLHASSGWPNVGAPSSSHSVYVLPQHLSASGNNAGGNWGISVTGLYGATWRGDNHASPGFVETTPQPAFAPSPDAAWSMVVLPDTQNYVERTHAYPLFLGQTNWIKNNKDQFNIQAVLHEGDIVNRNSGTASNGVTAVQQWERARDAMHVLNGVVPYIMTLGNHDYGTTNSQSRDTKFNTYFKATDNPLVNPATGGILRELMNPGELQNAFYEFTGPDGRDMLVLALEFWARNSAVNWAKDVAQQQKYADHTAVLLTHSHVNPNNGFWTTGPNAYQMEGGNDGQDVWNKLLSVSSNFEMAFNGHLGGNEAGYKVDKNSAGEDVHQMFFNTQQESNAGNGWLRVVEFMKDGETVRIRTYSPHFDLYRTSGAHDFTFKITHVGTPLVWNAGSVVFNNGFARSDGEQGVGVEAVSPWGAGGKENLLVGFGGNATMSGSANRTVASLRVGTDQADAVIAGRNGDGTVTANGSINLTLSSSTGTGDLAVGEGGYSGTLNWNSSGTLEVQGRLRIGQGGNGTFNQTDGVVIAGNTSGSLKFLAIGHTTGSQGVYNLNNGVFRPSGGFAGTEFRQTRVGDDGAVGELNVGDGVGAANSAAFESNDDLFIGREGGTGLLRVRSDGRVELRTNTNPAELLIGQNSIGTVIQTGGTVTSDNLVRIGSNPGGVGHYTISAGTLATATAGSGTFQIGRNGAAGTLRVEGTANVSHGAELFIGAEPHANTEGRLELIGSAATVQIGQLANAPGGANGVRETIFWQADADGITPLVVTGSGPLASHRVQLQNPSELAANSGTGHAIAGDGIALELDLAAITASMSLLLIDNRTADAVTGFFEDGDTRNLFGEGEQIFGTGFQGTVTISYEGGDGNDVVLNLQSAGLLGDHNGDGVVDAADYVLWRKTGVNGQQGFIDWRSNFGARAANAAGAGAAVPEPGGCLLLALGAAAIHALRLKSAQFSRDSHCKRP